MTFRRARPIALAMLSAAVALTLLPMSGLARSDNLTAMVTGLSLTYDVANELTKTTQGTSTTTYADDARGNRISASGGTNATYGYDQANRLTSLGAVSYKYDGDGLRMQTVNGSTTRSFSWDQVEGVPLLLSEGQNIYLAGPGGQLLEQVSNGGTPYWYHRDQQGSVSALTGPTGAYAGGYSYGPYGETPQSTVPASILNPFQYAGEYVDAESGLAYLRARFYDPATGQFLNRDPITPLSRQAYGYAGGSPLNLRDPAGLDPQIPGQQSTPQSGGAQPGDCPACDILQQVGTPSEPPSGGSGTGPCLDPTQEPGPPTAAEGGADAASLARGGVYSLRDETGAVVRTGRTSDLAAREAAHFNDPVLGEFQFNAEYRTDVYAQQRGLEQILYERYPGAQAVNGGFNKIRAISLRNPNLDTYMQAAWDYLGRMGQ